MKTQRGEIWQLGDHRLAVMDCVHDDLNPLFKEKVRLIATDPPYGVAYVENKKTFKRKGEDTQIAVDREIENDQLQSTEQYSAFTKAWMEKVRPFLDTYNAFYIFNAELQYCSMREGIENAGYYYSQMIIWIKNSVVVGRKDYLPQHELIAYGWYGRHKFERAKGKTVVAHAEDEKIDGLVFEDKRSSSRLHPTMKPVGLMRKLILNSTKIGEVVYDPFGGSGSTLMACEHTKRKCYMTEVDPVYCDTIIARWEKLTGRKAEKVS